MLPEDVHEEAPYSGRDAEEGADAEQTLAGLQHVDEHPNTRTASSLLGEFLLEELLKIRSSLASQPPKKRR